MEHPQPLSNYDWESLDTGKTLRVPCDHWSCAGKSNAFTITKISGGCVYNCYRCGRHGAVYKGLTPDQAKDLVNKLRQKRHETSLEARSVTLPDDHIPLVTFSKEVPPQAYAWLYVCELDEDDMDTYYISYSPKLQRVIIPIYTNNKLIAWQGRDIYYNRNKDLYSKGIIKNKPLKYYTEYNSKKDSILSFNIYNNNSNNIIIVEDILSSIKVYNKYKYNVLGLLNSTLHNRIIKDYNLYNYNNVYIWLDPDAHVKAVQGALRWQNLGVNARCVRTDTDPKMVPYKLMPTLGGE